MADDDDGIDAESEDTAYQAAADLDRQDLLLIRQAPGVLAELRSLEDVADAVIRARDKALIAIYDRLRRAARRDIPFG